VWSSSVVARDPTAERTTALRAGAERLAVGAFAQRGLDDSFGFAVRAWPIGPGNEMLDPEVCDRCGVDLGAIAGAVVGHDSLHAHTVVGEPVDRSFQEPDAGGPFSSGRISRYATRLMSSTATWTNSQPACRSLLIPPRWFVTR
jgi:hypothetical protein